MSTRRRSNTSFLSKTERFLKTFLPPVLAGVISYYYLPENKDFSSQLSAIASVCATLLGFIVAAVTIIIAIDQRRLIQKMKEYGHYDVLLRSMLIAGLLMLLTTLIAFVASFTGGKIHHGMVIATIISTAQAFTAFVIATDRLWKVMKVLSKE